MAGFVSLGMIQRVVRVCFCIYFLTPCMFCVSLHHLSPSPPPRVLMCVEVHDLCVVIYSDSSKQRETTAAAEHLAAALSLLQGGWPEGDRSCLPFPTREMRSMHMYHHGRIDHSL